MQSNGGPGGDLASAKTNSESRMKWPGIETRANAERIRSQSNKAEWRAIINHCDCSTLQRPVSNFNLRTSK